MLLKLIEGTVASVPPQGGCISAAGVPQVDTGNMLLIRGAFAGLDKVIRERTEKNSIGFLRRLPVRTIKSTGDVIRNVETEDLVKYGLIPNCRRLPVVATLTELDEEVLADSHGAQERPDQAVSEAV